MTKEPIMFDDIDVSECEHKTKVYEDYKCEIHNLEQCSDFPNCYFKQLKRKEQELVTANCIALNSNMRNGQLFEKLNQLKGEVHHKTEFIQEQRDIIDQLKAELKEFKDMAKQGLDNYKDVGGCWGCGISLAFDELLKTCKALETKNAILISNRMNMFERLDIVQKNEKYKQALQGIKEIAEDDCKICTVKLLGEDEINCKRCYKTKILQKCEVIDETKN